MMTRDDVVQRIGPRWAVALTLCHENGFDSPEAARDRLFIAGVIANRLRTRYRRRATARDVCLDRKQFSCWNAGRSKNHLALLARATRWMQGGEITDSVERQALWLAEGVVAGVLPDLVQGARHYHTHTVSPSWSRGKTPVMQSTWHRYFVGIP